MKKLMYFAAALLVLVGCNKKDNALNNAPEGTPFEKGQQVTLTVGTGALQGPNKVAGVDNTAENRIDFTWVEGDKILVKVGDKTAEFTLTTGAGTNSAEFAGEMPAAGSSFDIQYPIEEPNLAGQFCSPIPANKMLFTATGCTLGESASLAAQYAMVQLNLYGTDITIGQIVLTNTTADPAVSYTLYCTGVTIGTTSTAATPFYMVVPAGVYQFEVEVYDYADEPAKICSFATSAAQTFTAGKCLNMPAKEVKALFIPTYVDLGLPSGLKWATCNVGATTPEGYGDHFAWGETSPKEVYYRNTYKWCIEDGALTKYCTDESVGYDEFTDGKTSLDSEDDAAHVNWGDNWRMPTKDEFEELENSENCEWVWQEDYNSTGVNGYLVKSKKEGYTDNSIFLPASGFCDESSVFDVGSEGFYWSSSLDSDDDPTAAHCINFNSDEKLMFPNVRYKGFSVRPVCTVVE